MVSIVSRYLLHVGVDGKNRGNRWEGVAGAEHDHLRGTLNLGKATMPWYAALQALYILVQALMSEASRL